MLLRLWVLVSFGVQHSFHGKCNEIGWCKFTFLDTEPFKMARYGFISDAF